MVKQFIKCSISSRHLKLSKKQVFKRDIMGSTFKYLPNFPNKKYMVDKKFMKSKIKFEITLETTASQFSTRKHKETYTQEKFSNSIFELRGPFYKNKGVYEIKICKTFRLVLF